MTEIALPYATQMMVLKASDLVGKIDNLPVHEQTPIVMECRKMLEMLAEEVRETKAREMALIKQQGANDAQP